MSELCEMVYERSGYVLNALGLETAMVDSIGLGFSPSPNSIHDVPAFLAMMSAMSMHDACANEGSELLVLEASKYVPRDAIPLLKIPTPQWTLGLLHVDHDWLEGACNRALDAQIRALLNMGVLPGANLVCAYDTHSSHNYGKTEHPLYIVSGPHSAGTNDYVRFMTGAGVSGGYTITTAFCRMKKGMTNAECVARILDDEARRGLDVLYRIWDKGFYSVEAMRECGKRNQYFLMYAVETPKIKKAIEAYKKGERKQAELFTVGSGPKGFTGKLAMVEKTRRKNGKKVVDILPFFTNMPRGMLRKALKGLKLEMKRRWRIETGYRCIEMAKPMTTSTWPKMPTPMETMKMRKAWAGLLSSGTSLCTFSTLWPSLC